MAQILLDTVDFSTVPVTYTAGTQLHNSDGNWLNLTSNFNPALVSTPNGGVAANSGGGATRTGVTWTADQWVQMKLEIVPTSYGLIGLRVQTAVSNGYLAGVNPGGSNRYRIYRYDAGVSTSLGFTTRDPTVGDIMNFQVVGSSLTLLVYDSSMVLQETLGPITDATYDGTGTANPGVFAAHSDTTTKILSTWTAGSVGAAASTTAPMFRGS